MFFHYQSAHLEIAMDQSAYNHAIAKLQPAVSIHYFIALHNHIYTC